MTTLNMDDALFRQAREVATERGESVDEFVAGAVRQAVSQSRVRRTVRNGLPVMVVNDGATKIDPSKVRDCLEEEGF